MVSQSYIEERASAGGAMTGFGAALATGEPEMTRVAAATAAGNWCSGMDTDCERDSGREDF